MSLKRGLITVWVLAAITILKVCLVFTLCRLGIDTKHILLCKNERCTSVHHRHIT